MAMLVKLLLSQLPTLFLVMLCACTVQAEEAVSISETAGVFSTWQDRVIQIQVIDKQAGTKAGIGSGFFAGTRTRGARTRAGQGFAHQFGYGCPFLGNWVICPKNGRFIS